jgi:hypothetical protein
LPPIWHIRSSATVAHGFWGRQARGGAGAIRRPPFAVVQVVQACSVFGRRGGVPARQILLAQPSLFRPFQGDLLMPPRDGIPECPFAPPAGRTDVKVSPPRGACIHRLGTGGLSPHTVD